MNKRPTIKYRIAQSISRPWSAEDDVRLRRMVLRGDLVEDVARTLKRTVAAVQQRFMALDLSVASNLELRAVRNRKHQRP